MDGLGATGPARAFAARIPPDRAGRLAQGLVAAVAHLRALVDDARPSPAEWRDVVAFLTEVGHAADSRRQEWVLLLDALGLSAQVEALGSPRPAGATPCAPAPFYRPGAPLCPPGADLRRDGRGDRLAVAGRVLRLDGRPVAGAAVEVWGASAEGVHENQDPDGQPDMNLRGRFRADEEGRFALLTARPGRTRLPVDGPVGRLLLALGLPTERPRHLGLRVTAPGFLPLATQAFDAGDDLLDRDPLWAARPELVHEVRRRGDGWAMDLSLVLSEAP